MYGIPELDEAVEYDRYVPGNLAKIITCLVCTLPLVGVGLIVL